MGFDKTGFQFYNGSMKKGIIVVIFLMVLLPFVQPANVSILPYGINVHLVENDVLQKVVDAGIKWIRTGANWSAVEIKKGSFDWSQVDRVVNFADSHDLSILFVIAYTPGWANENKGFIYPPDKVSDWENFVRITVNRYKNKVKYWDIWNEPNSLDFFALGKDVFVEKIFLPAAKVIRSADPSAFIVGPGLAHLNSLNAEWYFWLKYILTECRDYIDIVSHHIYKNEGVYYIYELLEIGEALLPSVQSIIEETGHGSKPLWITETGWDTLEFSENVQAERYLEMLQKQREKRYPDKIFFYEIIDDPSPGIDPWGILRSDRSEKPAYNVYKDFIAGLYPHNGGGGDDNGDVGKKKCYAEETLNSSRTSERQQTLSNLRYLRDTLNYFSPAAQELTRIYYQFNQQFLKLALSDSRIYRLGIELINKSHRLITKNRDRLLSQTLGTDMVSKAGDLLALLKEKKTSEPFKAAVTWAEAQLKLLKKMSLMDYLLKHFQREHQQNPVAWEIY
jgi:polysaccharide biosynthesis protein PslG